MTTNKKIRRYTRPVAMVTALLIMGAALAAIASVKPHSNTYTVYSDDGYYSETTYYLNEEDFARQIEASREKGDKYSTTSSELTPTGEDEEFVLGISKNVWVQEVTDEEGNVTESKLLKKQEIEEYCKHAATAGAKINPVAAKSSGNWFTDLWQSFLDHLPDPVGSDSGELYLLTVSMSVGYYPETQKYTVSGTASWAEQLVWFLDTYRAAEESYLDYISLTWGGENVLKAESKSCEGKYYDSDATFNCSRKHSDSYAGFVWQFNEKEGILGDELEYVKPHATLVRTGNLQNKETNVKLTYIHTYDVIEGNISFSIDSDGKLEASANLSKSEKQWQIELDVPGLEY